MRFALVDRSMADVRLEAGIQNLERVAVCEIVGEVELGAALTAKDRGLSLHVESVDPAIVVRADRQILAATVSNLSHNAMKFTGQETTVKLCASATATRVLIEVEDPCGGLPPGKSESLLEPFNQQGHDRTGLGLGLSICLKAVKAIDGELRIQLGSSGRFAGRLWRFRSHKMPYVNNRLGARFQVSRLVPWQVNSDSIGVSHG